MAMRPILVVLIAAALVGACDGPRQGDDAYKDAAQMLAAGRAYLQENAAKDGVVVLPSGLQYEVLSEGEGTLPSPRDRVRVHYAGRLIDGSEFDSSYKRDEPAVFPLDRVIPGWTQGLQLMRPGAKYRFTIPHELAYGTEGRPPVIPPNAVLVFDVELLEVLATE